MFYPPAEMSYPPAEGERGCHRRNNADHVVTRAAWKRRPLDEAAVELGPVPQQCVESKDTHRPQGADRSLGMGLLVDRRMVIVMSFRVTPAVNSYVQ